MSRQCRRIALSSNLAVGYARRVLEGLKRYAVEQGNWMLEGDIGGPGVSARLEATDADGIIYCAGGESSPDELVSLGIPTIFASSFIVRAPHVSWVNWDFESLGCVAAEHFLARGHRHFGLVASRNESSELAFPGPEIRAGMDARLASVGQVCEVFPGPMRSGHVLLDDLTSARQCGQWLRGLPKPVAVFAVSDYLALVILEACRREQLSVPQEVAILGSGNDPLLCDMQTTTLSSIEQPHETVGYIAGKLLDQIFHRGRSPKPVTLSGFEVAVRESTQSVATSDPVVLAAGAFIREHYARDIGVQDVAIAALVNRRTLERRFLKALGRSVHDEIVSVRIERIKELLRETDLPIYTVASKCGFRNPNHMAALFGRVTSSTPTGYRRRFSVTGQ